MITIKKQILKQLFLVLLAFTISICTISISTALTVQPLLGPSAPSGIEYVTNFTDVTVGETDNGGAGLNRTDMYGYIHVLRINESSVTKRWKGYVGNVTGEIGLQNANGQQLYDWTMATIAGEIYAVYTPYIYATGQDVPFPAGQIPQWDQIKCAQQTEIVNYTLYLDHYVSDAGQPYDDALNITFGTSSRNTGYPTFTVANKTFNIGGNTEICPNINLQNSTPTDVFGYGRDTINATHNRNTSALWDEVLLSVNSSSTLGDSPYNMLVFAALLENGLPGFDGNRYNFQMILPDNATEAAVPTTPIGYTFFVELG